MHASGSSSADDAEVAGSGVDAQDWEALEATIAHGERSTRRRKRVRAIKEIEEKGFDLSIDRYKEAQHEEQMFEAPKVSITKLRKLEAEIATDLNELEAML